MYTYVLLQRELGVPLHGRIRDVAAGAPAVLHVGERVAGPALALLGRTLEAPIPKMSGLVKKVGPFSKRTNPL